MPDLISNDDHTTISNQQGSTNIPSSVIANSPVSQQSGSLSTSQSRVSNQIPSKQKANMQGSQIVNQQLVQQQNNQVKQNANITPVQQSIDHSTVQGATNTSSVNLNNRINEQSLEDNSVNSNLADLNVLQNTTSIQNSAPANIQGTANGVGNQQVTNQSNLATPSNTQASLNQSLSSPNQSQAVSNNVQSQSSNVNQENKDTFPSFLDDDLWDDDSSTTNTKSKPKKMSQEERIEMIKKVYKKVLNREATTSDINYYKYTDYSEEELVNKLLESDEHKNLLKKGVEYDELLQKYETLQMNSQNLQGTLNSQQIEFNKLLALLEEKNKHIEVLRKKLDDPYGTGLCTVDPIKTNNSQ